MHIWQGCIHAICNAYAQNCKYINVSIYQNILMYIICI